MTVYLEHYAGSPATSAFSMNNLSAVAAAASQPITPTNNVTLQTYWRNFTSVVSSAQCYSALQRVVN